MKGALCVAMLATLVAVTVADVYFHNPRGSNNRLNERSANRRNANRAFDSQVWTLTDYSLECSQPRTNYLLMRECTKVFTVLYNFENHYDLCEIYSTLKVLSKSLLSFDLN